MLKVGKAQIHKGAYIEHNNCTVVIGDGSIIFPWTWIRMWGDLEIGKNVTVHPFCMISGHGKIVIGDDTRIAGGCKISSSNHVFSDPETPIRKQAMEWKGVTIGRDCWFGHNVIVLDGVTIGDGCVIGAGAVVTKDVPAYSVAFGNPCRVHKSRK